MQPTAKRQLFVRLTVFIMAVVVVLLLIGGAAEAESPPAPTIEYVVSDGDTLWAIASAHADQSEDVRRLIAEIRSVSGLQSSVIFPGQILLIPQA